MKFFTNLFLFLFIVFATYLLLNENNGVTKKVKIKRIEKISGANSKSNTLIKTQELNAYELQRQRINSETIYKFQSNDTGESFELNDLNEKRK